jgi:acetylornithine aminotransferase
MTSKPDIICMAKGMGNGFQSVEFHCSHFEELCYLLGTTLKSFCCAIAVLEVMESQSLMETQKK